VVHFETSVGIRRDGDVLQQKNQAAAAVVSPDVISYRSADCFISDKYKSF
jgi:hypothetical protein